MGFLIDYVDRDGAQYVEFFESAEISKGEYRINGRLVLEGCHRRITNLLRDQIGLEKSPVRAFVESFLNPEENGRAVSAYIRDEARAALGMKRVEGPHRNNN
jgi:hypothetical protein